MSLPQILVVCVVILPLIAVLLKWIRMDYAAIFIATMLAFLQFIGFEIFGKTTGRDVALLAFSGFGRPTVIVLVCLFTLTGALERSGFARWITKKILIMGGNSINRLIFLFSSAAAFLSLFINDVAVGALLIPSVLETYKLTSIKPSKLLIPVAFGSLLGGMATYFTTANIMIDDLLTAFSADNESLNFFSFFPLGGLIIMGGLIFLAIFGDRLLPGIESQTVLDIERSTGSELEAYYELYERTWQVDIKKGSLLVGQTVEDIGFGSIYGLTLVVIYHKRNNYESPTAKLKIKSGDQLLVIGREERVEELDQFGVRITSIEKEKTLSKQGISVFEFLVAPRSSVAGKTLKALKFRQKYGLSVMALQRGKRIYRTDVGSLQLAIGDSLLVVGKPFRFDALRSNKEFIVLEPSSSDHPMNIKNTLISLCVLLGSMIISALGVPIYLALLTAVLILLAEGTISLHDMYEMIEWRIIFFVGCMYGVSLAIIETGLADTISRWIMPLTENLGVTGLAGISFLMSSIIAQFMGGQVAALITGPIALSSAINNDINLSAIAIATAIGCSNCFLTHMSHGVNLIMMTPGGYDIKDYFRLGKWLFLISFIGLLLGMKLFY